MTLQKERQSMEGKRNQGKKFLFKNFIVRKKCLKLDHNTDIFKNCWIVISNS